MDITLTNVLESDYKDLSELYKEWLPKAKQDETAVSAVVRIMQQRQAILRAYTDLLPEEETSVARFQKMAEDRRKKTATKYK